MAGRLSAVIPFLPFSDSEQAVLAHRSLLRLAHSLEKPVRQPNRLVGNVTLRVCQDTALCRVIAREGYHIDTGARGIDAVVNRKVKTHLCNSTSRRTRRLTKTKAERAMMSISTKTVRLL